MSRQHALGIQILVVTQTHTAATYNVSLGGDRSQQGTSGIDKVGCRNSPQHIPGHHSPAKEPAV